MMRRYAFTLLELIFVIVIMGIIGKFGIEFLAQAYKGFIFSSVNHTLQSNSEMAVETIAAKLQFRIKDSVIARQTDVARTFTAIGSAGGDNWKILEWVGNDIDGLRGCVHNGTDYLPNWSGIIDLDASITASAGAGNILVSPGTDTTRTNSLISTISGIPLDDAAIYFIGSDSDINAYGWGVTGGGVGAFTDQSNVMHPIKSNGVANQLVPRDASDGSTNSFSGEDIFEYYQLAWTAYAVGITDYNTGVNAGHNVGTLKLWYNYQPWNGEIYTDGKSSVLMNNVSTFRFKSVGSVIKIQVCTKSLLLNECDGGYSLCKEKTIF